MPKIPVNRINLYYEEAGRGVPIIFAHEFAGDWRSWEPQMRFFSGRYRAITYSARGYLPSDVPDSPEEYSQDLQIEDLKGLLDALKIEKAHICGLSMGSYTTLLFGLKYPDRARSLTIAGSGYGSGKDRQVFHQRVNEMADRMLKEWVRRECSCRIIIPGLLRNSAASSRSIRPKARPSPSRECRGGGLTSRTWGINSRR
jgi:pimeloyl-ACP methyl ester carboxylesterase